MEETASICSWHAYEASSQGIVSSSWSTKPPPMSLDAVADPAGRLNDVSTADSASA